MAVKDKKCLEKKDSLYLARGSVKVELRQPTKGLVGLTSGFSFTLKSVGSQAYSNINGLRA